MVGDYSNILFDAVFGQQDTSDDPIEEYHDVKQGVDVIMPVVTMIRNDFRPEPEECFTIHIHQVDELEPFSCNKNDSSTTSFFCETTICIQDDDGRFTACVSYI